MLNKFHSDTKVFKMPPKDFKCKQCGHCCLDLYDAFSTCATEDDIRIWDSNGRDDILEWVDPISLGTMTISYMIFGLAPLLMMTLKDALG